MSTGQSKLVRFWTRPVRPERVAAFRIAIGTLVLLDTLVSLWPNAAEFFGPNGLLPSELYRLQQDGLTSWSLLPAGATVAEVRLFLLALMGAATLVTAGLATRVASIAMWVLLVSLQRRNPYILTGGDLVLSAAAFYLIIMRAGAAWSIDAHLQRRRGGSTAARIPAWPLRLAQIQLALIYLFTGLSKLPVPDGPGVGQWLSGHAIAAALSNPTLARFEFLTLVPWWVWAPLTWAILAWEILFPLLICLRALRPATLAFGVMVHLGIFLTLEVHNFSFAVLAYYLLFLPDNAFKPGRTADRGMGDL